MKPANFDLRKDPENDNHCGNRDGHPNASLQPGSQINLTLGHYCDESMTGDATDTCYSRVHDPRQESIIIRGVFARDFQGSSEDAQLPAPIGLLWKPETWAVVEFIQ